MPNNLMRMSELFVLQDKTASNLSLRIVQPILAILGGFLSILLILLSLTVAQAGPISLPSFVSLVYIEIEPALTNQYPLRFGSGGCKSSYETGADLEIEKTVDNFSPNEKDTIVYEITVTNNGPEQAGWVEVTDILTGGVTYSSTFTSKDGPFTYSSTASGITGSWTIKKLKPCESATLIITATINSGTSGTSITNTVKVATPDNPHQDPDISNNSQTIVIAVSGSDLVVTKTVNDKTPDFGELIIYTITITNNGSVEAANVQISDTLPTGIIFKDSFASQGSYDDADGKWDVGALASNVTAKLTITAQVDTCPVDSRPITNTARLIHAEPPDATPASNASEAVITVICADLEVTQTVRPATAHDGDTVTYTITITNHGSSTATHIILKDKLPGETIYLSHQDSQIAYNELNSQWEMGDLTKGMSKTLNIIAQADICGTDKTITNTVEVNSVEDDPFLLNNQFGVNLDVLTNTLCYIYLPIIFKNYDPPICIAYSDDFSDYSSANHWESDNYQQTQLGYTAQVGDTVNKEKYFIHKKVNGLRIAQAPITLTNKFSTTVEVYADGGMIGEYGMTFGQVGNNVTSPTYRFLVNPLTQKYRLEYGNSATGWKCINKPAPCEDNPTLPDVIHSGAKLNHLAVECDGTKATLYINYQQVWQGDLQQIWQSMYPPPAPKCYGQLGLIAHTYNIPQTKAYFDNFQLSCPFGTGLPY